MADVWDFARQDWVNMPRLMEQFGVTVNPPTRVMNRYGVFVDITEVFGYGRAPAGGAGDDSDEGN